MINRQMIYKYVIFQFGGSIILSPAHLTHPDTHGVSYWILLFTLSFCCWLQTSHVLPLHSRIFSCPRFSLYHLMNVFPIQTFINSGHFPFSCLVISPCLGPSPKFCEVWFKFVDFLLWFYCWYWCYGSNFYCWYYCWYHGHGEKLLILTLVLLLTCLV